MKNFDVSVDWKSIVSGTSQLDLSDEWLENLLKYTVSVAVSCGLLNHFNELLASHYTLLDNVGWDGKLSNDITDSFPSTLTVELKNISTVQDLISNN